MKTENFNLLTECIAAAIAGVFVGAFCGVVSRVI